MPCMSPDGFYAEWLPTSGVNLNTEMMYLHNADQKEEKHLVDDVTIKEEKSSNEGQQKTGPEGPMPCRSTSSDKLNAEHSPATPPPQKKNVVL